MILDAITECLKSEVPDLKGRVEQILEMSKLLRDGRLPQNAQALVIPLDGLVAQIGA